MTEIQYIDNRLLEAVAMCLCWAEFSDHSTRTDTPAEYWSAMPQEGRQKYYHDASAIASAMTSDRFFAVVPMEHPDPSGPSATKKWHDTIALARRQMRWRDGAAANVAGRSESAAGEGR